MEFRLHLNTRKWEVRYPQCGSQTGWSEWSSLNRQEALRYIERGWSFTTI